MMKEFKCRESKSARQMTQMYKQTTNEGMVKGFLCSFSFANFDSPFIIPMHECVAQNVQVSLFNMFSKTYSQILFYSHDKRRSGNTDEQKDRQAAVQADMHADTTCNTDRD